MVDFEKSGTYASLCFPLSRLSVLSATNSMSCFLQFVWLRKPRWFWNNCWFSSAYRIALYDQSKYLPVLCLWRRSSLLVDRDAALLFWREERCFPFSSPQLSQLSQVMSESESKGVRPGPMLSLLAASGKCHPTEQPCENSGFSVAWERLL